MKRNHLRLLALLLCLLLPFSACAQTAEPEQEVTPNLTQLLNEYTTLDLTPYLGKTVIVSFFTEWCMYCMQEMPNLRQLNDLYDPEQFQLVLVHVWDGEDETNTQSVKDRFDMHHMTFFEDEDRLVASLVGVPGFPATLIADGEGNVIAGQSGVIPFDALTAFLDELGVERAAVE